MPKPPSGDDVTAVRGEPFGGEPAGGRLVLGRDRVLEVDDDRVGPGFGRLGQLALAVAGDEQPRADGHQATAVSVMAG